MSSEAQREHLERRLRELQAMRLRDATVAAQVERGELDAEAAKEALRGNLPPQFLEVNGVQVAMGSRVSVKNSMAVFVEAERGVAVRDIAKEIYLGETGTVKALVPNFLPSRPAVEIQFADGVCSTFFVECLDLGSSTTMAANNKSASTTATTGGASAAAAERASTMQRIQKASEPLPLVAETAVSAPNWGSLRRPGAKAVPITPQPATPPPQLASRNQTTTEGEADPPSPPPPQQQQNNAEEASTSSSSVVAQIKEDEPTTDTAADAPHVNVLPIGTSGGTSPNSPDVDNLLATPRGAFMRLTSNTVGGRGVSLTATFSGMEASPDLAAVPAVQEGRGGAAAALLVVPPVMESVAPTSTPSSIPPCPSNYRAMYPLGDPRSRIPRASMASPVSVKHCTVIPLRLFSKADNLSVAQKKDRYGVPIAYRSHHDTLPSYLAATTRELGWTTERVERLFLTDGKEVMWCDAIVDGSILVASNGEGYEAPPPPPPRPAATATRSIGARAVSPAHKPKPIINAAQMGKPLVVKVFSNGEYGDVETERLPYRTVTIRSTHKTLPSVLTMIGRELAWNVLGRKVEILYSARGEEIKNLESLHHGDCVVASTGDRFVVPRHNTVLHAEVQKLSASESHPAAAAAAAAPPPAVSTSGKSMSGRVSPSRRNSQMAAAGSSAGPQLSPRERANQLLKEIRAIEQQQQQQQEQQEY